MSEGRVLKTEETNAFVLNLADKCFDLISSEMDKIHPGQTFILTGRVINHLVAKFYSLTLARTETYLREKEKEKETQDEQLPAD